MRISPVLPFLLIFAFLTIPDGSGIGMRHDVNSQAYLNLAANSSSYPPGAYPNFSAVAALGIPLESGGFEVAGSATLVAPQWVLTAAHVVLNKKQRFGEFDSRLRVRFGLDALVPDIEREIQGIATPLDPKTLKALHASGWLTQEKRVVHAEFHDLALVRLKEPVNNIPPLAICKDSISLMDLRVLVAGYGHAGVGDAPDITGWSEPRYKHAAENVIDRDLYTNPYTGKREGGLILFDFDDGTDLHNTLNGTMVPAWSSLFGDGVSSAEPLGLEGAPYPGDSGGPALARINGVWQIIGVSGYGTGFPPDRKRSDIGYGEILVFTRVPSHAEWIDQILATSE